jgi:hypothetical protein
MSQQKQTTPSSNYLKEFLDGTTVSQSASYFVPQMGQNLIRIVVKGTPITQMREHFIKWSAACFGQRCPICYIASKYNLQDWTAREMRMVYVADLTNPQPLIKLFSFGPMIASKLNLLARNYDILDPKHGIVLLLQRTGQGRNTKYEILPKEPLDLTALPDYNIEYEALIPLGEIPQKRIEETKSSLIRNFEAYLPPDIFNAVVTDLKERGYLQMLDIDESFVDFGSTQVSSQITEPPPPPPLIGPHPTIEDIQNVQDILKRLKKQ